MRLFDAAYILGLTVAAPYWMLRPRTREKVRSALRDRMARTLPPPPSGSGPLVLLHAVSVGELNATPSLIRSLAAARPDVRFLVTTTTQTGWARAGELYGDNRQVAVARFPLDFSWAVRRLLTAFSPAVAVLMELEVWPNFVAECAQRQIPVSIVNGRLTTSSFRGYRLLRPLTGKMFAQLTHICAQDRVYADRFIASGADPQRVSVTGTMKFDTAGVQDRVEGDTALAQGVGIEIGAAPVWVCGSTGPGEEELVLATYRSLLATTPTLRLVIVPRKPERFDEVAERIRTAGFPVLRRSRPQPTDGNPVILGDTMGELRKFYSLADVVFVGRSLVDLGPRQHGSDMIEPSALGKPVIVGPFTHNFADAMSRFVAADAIRIVRSAAELVDAVAALLADRATASAMGQRARRIVQQEQGATARNADVILRELQQVAPPR
jgi:3-deoxy-D-manno-octulosonic-acid transferase